MSTLERPRKRASPQRRLAAERAASEEPPAERAAPQEPPAERGASQEPRQLGPLWHVNPFPTNTTPREISQPKHLTGFEIGVCANIVQRAFEAHGSRTGERAPEELWGMFSKYVFQDNWTTNQLPPAIDSSIWPDFRPIRVSRRAGLGNLGYGHGMTNVFLVMELEFEGRVLTGGHTEALWVSVRYEDEARRDIDEKHMASINWAKDYEKVESRMREELVRRTTEAFEVYNSHRAVLYARNYLRDRATGINYFTRPEYEYADLTKVFFSRHRELEKLRLSMNLRPFGLVWPTQGTNGVEGEATTEEDGDTATEIAPGMGG